MTEFTPIYPYKLPLLFWHHQILTVSKGNEKEGFESYGFVCRPLILEEDYNNGGKR